MATTRARHLDATLALSMECALGALPRRRIVAWAAVAVALLGLTVCSPGIDHAPLGTSYELTLAPATAEQPNHHEDTAIPTYRADQTIEAWLQPRDPVSGPLAVEVVARRGNAVRRLAVEPEISPQGVVHIVAPIVRFDLIAGDWDLAFIVGRPETIPDDLAPTRAVTGEARPYQVHIASIRIVEPKR